jgi:hypothetical protein
LLRELSSQELTEWGAFYQLEPWGYRPEMWRAGLVSSSIYNVNRPKRTSKIMKAEDFIPKEPTGEHDEAGLREKIQTTFQHIAIALKSKGPS